MRFMRRTMIGAGLIAVALWLTNTSAFVTVPQDQASRLLAHRGVHQIYAGEDRTADTCTANPIFPAEHDFIANTHRSIEAAFEFGADVVEIDVHLTTDDVFAVFHDWTLDCQTDGTGVTHKQSYADLQLLDLGFGYTSDGITYPLRGSAVGAMPTLSEVLSTELDGQILINFKSKRAEEGTHLAAMLADDDALDQVFGVYGGGPPTQTALEGVTGLRGFDRAALRACLINYAVWGWSGYVPDTCQDTLVAVPMDYGPYLWGWPHKFTQRMNAAGSEVILWGPYDGSGFSSGIDDADTLAKVPAQFDGYIWTNRIEVIGPLMDVGVQNSATK